MSLLRKTILKQLLIEKTIGNMSVNVNADIYMEINRSSHAWERKTRPDLDGKSEYNQREISNIEINEILIKAKSEIGKKIVSQDIYEGVRFVVKSLKWEIAISIEPVQNANYDWTLNVITVFRESKENPFRVAGFQTTIWV
jgi:hypothetical protein